MSFDDIEININNNIRNDIFTSVIAEESPIVMQLKELGYDNIYSRRVFYYLHPENLDEALNYMAIENGIIQHRFIQERNNSNDICYICGERRRKHLNERNDLIDDDNNINNNNDINTLNKFDEDQKQEDIINESLNQKYDSNINKNDNDDSNKTTQSKSKAELISDEIDNEIIFPKNIFKFKHREIKKEKDQIITNNTREELKVKEEKMECIICGEMFIVNEKNKVEKCGHAFCPGCWYDSLSVKIKENKLPSIKCLEYNCKEKLTDDFIINLLNSDRYLIKIYKRYKLELEIINDPNKKLCPYPNCDSFLELKQKNNKNVKCENNHLFCFRCLQKPHVNLPCKDSLDESVMEYSKNNFVKKCPNCGIVIEKNKGCNHITCTKCEYQWCWLCNKEYKSGHFKEGKCEGFQFFQPKNENDIKLMMEGKIDKNNLSMSQRQFDHDEIDRDRPRMRRRRLRNQRDNEEIFEDIYYTMDFKQKIKKVLFYILFGNSFMVIKAFDMNDNCFQKYLNRIIYLMLFILFFFHLIFINIMSLIIIFIFSGFKRFIRDNNLFYTKRFVVFNLSIILIRFLTLFNSWKRVLTTNIYDGKLMDIILIFSCFNISVIVCFPQSILINVFELLILLLKIRNINLLFYELDENFPSYLFNNLN